jgi:hypothetical protein
MAKNPHEGTFVAQLPVGHADLKAIRRLATENALLVPGNFRMADPTDVLAYLQASLLHKTDFRVLFDRNLVTRLVGLVRGDPLPSDPASARIVRLSAAAIALCIMAEIEVEPGMALYEGAATHGHERAAAEHLMFRLADNVNPAYYVDIALGRSSTLPVDHLEELRQDIAVSGPGPRESNFGRILTVWKINYLFLLKAVELRRTSLSAFEAARRLLEWEADDAFYNASASIFCLGALSPQPPAAAMIKNAQSLIPQQLSAGLRNATWDAALVSQWGKWLREPDSPSWLLSTNDKGLRSIAKTVFVEAGSDSILQLRTFLETCWGRRQGQQLFKAYELTSAGVRVGTQARRDVVAERFSRIDDAVRELEGRLGIASAI